MPTFKLPMRRHSVKNTFETKSSKLSRCQSREKDICDSLLADTLSGLRLRDELLTEYNMHRKKGIGHIFYALIFILTRIHIIATWKTIKPINFMFDKGRIKIHSNQLV